MVHQIKPYPNRVRFYFYIMVGIGILIRRRISGIYARKRCYESLYERNRAENNPLTIRLYKTTIIARAIRARDIFR